AGLAELRPAAHRLVPVVHAARPLFVLDDCYNAKPAACIAALETARELCPPGERLVVVLGDMLELGEATRDAHREGGAARPRRAPGTERLVPGGAAARRLAAGGRVS